MVSGSIRKGREEGVPTDGRGFAVWRGRVWWHCSPLMVFQSSFKLEPEVVQDHCGNCEKATTLFTPSASMSSSASSVSGCAYRNAVYALCGAESGFVTSSILHISFPCSSVHFRMGDPPINSYCACTSGVRRLAMNSPRYFWTNGPPGSSMMSLSWNSRCKNGPVSSGVEGPPIFIIRTAVFGGVLDDAASSPAESAGASTSAAASAADVPAHRMNPTAGRSRQTDRTNIFEKFDREASGGEKKYKTQSRPRDKPSASSVAY